MNKNLRISIPEPCHEDWNRMTPAEKGRYCGSCQKVVMDFTSMSDPQIIAYFKKSGENTCGRFYNDQLNREIQTPRKRLPWVKYFLQVAIPAVFFSYRATAQGKPMKLGGVISSVAVDTAAKSSVTTKVEKVSGRVVDENGNGVPYASVIWAGTNYGMPTNENGEFSLEKKGEKLVFSSVGFITQTINISAGSTVTVNMVRSDVNLTVGAIVALPPNAVYGTVMNEDGDPLPNATVHIKGTGKVALADSNGYFFVKLNSRGKHKVSVEHIGYEKHEFTAKGGQFNEIVLKVKEDILQEVVVSGASSITGRLLITGGTSRISNCANKKTSLWDRIFGVPQQSFILYPNPVQASSELKVEWKMEPGEFKWEIMDMAGRSVKSGLASISAKSQTVIIDLPAAPAGTYILRFTDKKGKSYSGKFIVRP